MSTITEHAGAPAATLAEDEASEEQVQASPEPPAPAIQAEIMSSAGISEVLDSTVQPRTSSSNFILCTGLKKCMPRHLGAR